MISEIIRILDNGFPLLIRPDHHFWDPRLLEKWSWNEPGGADENLLVDDVVPKLEFDETTGFWDPNLLEEWIWGRWTSGDEK